MLRSALAVAAALAILEALYRAWAPRWADRGIDASSAWSPAWACARVLMPFCAGLSCALWYSSAPAGAAFASVASVGVLSVSTDLRCCKIPREPSWAGLAAAAGCAALGGSPAGWASALVASLVLGLAAVTTALVTRGGLGSGDVRLLLCFAPLACWSGQAAIVSTVLFAAALQVPIRALLRRRARTTAQPQQRGAPFAPALLIGLALGVAILGHPGTPCSEWALALHC